MAHTNIPVGSTGYTLITDTNVTAARVQNASGVSILIQASASTTPPTADGGAMLLLPYSIFAADYTLAQLFPGVSGAARLFAKAASAGVGGEVSVSHA